MTTDTNTSNLTEAQKAVIDRAVAAAKARKEAKEKAAAAAAVTEPKEKPAKKATEKTSTKEDKEKTAAEKKANREKELAESKAKREAEKAEKDAQRAKEKAERDADREARKAAKAAEKTTKEQARLEAKATKHMTKVEKYRSTLPAIDSTTKAVLDLVLSGGLTDGQKAVLAAHLAFENRVASTVRSAKGGTKLTVGQTVEIVSSDRDARLIGCKGTVTQVRKIRVLVSVPGRNKDCYLFTSDVIPAEAVVEPAAEAEPQFLAPDTDDATDAPTTDEAANG